MCTHTVHGCTGCHAHARAGADIPSTPHAQALHKQQTRLYTNQLRGGGSDETPKRREHLTEARPSRLLLSSHICYFTSHGAGGRATTIVLRCDHCVHEPSLLGSCACGGVERREKQRYSCFHYACALCKCMCESIQAMTPSLPRSGTL